MNLGLSLPLIMEQLTLVCRKKETRLIFAISQLLSESKEANIEVTNILRCRMDPDQRPKNNPEPG